MMLISSSAYILESLVTPFCKLNSIVFQLGNVAIFSGELPTGTGQSFVSHPVKELVVLNLVHPDDIF